METDKPSSSEGNSNLIEKRHAELAAKLVGLRFLKQQDFRSVRRHEILADEARSRATKTVVEMRAVDYQLRQLTDEDT